MTRYFVWLLPLLLNLTMAYAQNDRYAELIMEGVELHDAGYYSEAIAKYREAQRVNVERSDVAYYEIALSYQAMGDYAQSIKAADKAMKYEGEHYVSAAMVKAISLDYQGKSKQSIRLFDQLIERYPEEQRLVFNAGVTCLRNEQTEKGVDHFQHSLELDVLHASSHYYMALGLNTLNRPIQSLMAYYMYLLLEPDHPERSPAALKAIQELHRRGVSTMENGNTLIQIQEGEFEGMVSDRFALIATLLQLRAAAISSSEDIQTGQEYLQASTRAFFEVLEVTQGGNTPVAEFWDNTYINLFLYFHSNEATDAFACYIAKYFNSDCKRWIEEHPEAIEAFFRLFE
jgi:tetratricopeptide (TPR) repeat protein